MQDKTELTERQKMILKAVIDSHVQSGEPIGSKLVAEMLPEGTPIVRVMPNINAAIGASTSGLCANALVTAEQKALVRAMFETIGTVAEVTEEADIDI